MKKHLVSTIVGLLALAVAPGAAALGTVAGTDIDNTAEVSYEVAGAEVSEVSNTLRVTVAEILDVDVTLRSPAKPVSPGDTAEELLFTVTNIGNGNEAFALLIDSALAGDNFDPTPTAPTSIYFDSDASGDLSPGDTQYNPGVNDPLLAPDAAIDVLIVNDIPATAADGERGLSLLDATAVTGSGAPGTLFAGAGDGGVDALAGTSGANDSDTGEYIVSDVRLDLVKSASVVDPFGTAVPVPGAQITYAIVITPSGSGTASLSTFNDRIPANTTYVAGTLRLNGAPLTDAPDADAGQLVTLGSDPAINVSFGDLTSASGPQTVEFTVTID